MSVTPDLLPATAEIFVLIMTCIILVVDTFTPEKYRASSYILTQGTLLGALLITIGLYTEQSIVTFHNTFILDPLASMLKGIIYIVVFAVLIYSKHFLQQHKMFKGEYFVLMLASVLGMMVMVSAYSFVTLYLGLELLSLSLYAMIAMQDQAKSAPEAAMKYFVLGAMASGLLLYGMSMIYGATGTLHLAEIQTNILDKFETHSLLLSFGLVFIIVAVAFKLGAVPFHMWVPDVYHGAPTAVTIFIGSAPKIAAFAMLFRLLVDGLESLHTSWQDILIILAILSMAVGNIIAIAQTNIKRMLAYSTVAHVGFILLGILSVSQSGYSASMFYTITYTIMAVGGFGMVLLLSHKGFDAERISDFKGLSTRAPWFAVMMMIFMFSMAGVPPFLGFWAKLLVLKAVVVEADMVWLAAIAVFFSIIGIFYYLRIIKFMFFDKAEDSEHLTITQGMAVTMSINGVVVLLLGLYPGILLTYCVQAITHVIQ